MSIIEEKEIQVVLVLCEIWVPTGFAQTEIAQKKHFPHKKQWIIGGMRVLAQKTSIF